MWGWIEWDMMVSSILWASLTRDGNNMARLSTRLDLQSCHGFLFLHISIVSSKCSTVLPTSERAIHSCKVQPYYLCAAM